MAKTNAAKRKALCVVVPFPNQPVRTPAEELIGFAETVIRINQINIDWLTDYLEKFKAATRGNDPKKAD